MARARSQWSGQYFIENVPAIGADSSDIRWGAKTVGTANGFTKSRSKGPGIDSLLDVATRVCLANSAFLTPETLENVPWHVGSRLWEVIKRNQLDSIQVWEAFAATYQTTPESSGLKYRFKWIRMPQAPLLDYIAPIRSDTLSWLVILTLKDMTVTRSQIVKGIASLVSLELLTLGSGLKLKLDENDQDHTLGVDDAIIRAWATHSIEFDPKSLQKPFGAIRSLTLAMQPEITGSCLAHCLSFPSLQLVNFINCQSMGQTSPKARLERGWRPNKLSYEQWATWTEKKPNNTHFSGLNNFNLACLRFVDSIAPTSDCGTVVRKRDSLPRLQLLLGEDSFFICNYNEHFGFMSYVRDAISEDYDEDHFQYRANSEDKPRKRSKGLRQKKQGTVNVQDTLSQFLS